MTHFEDKSPYTYLEGERRKGLLNIGWLDASHTHEEGDVPADFVGRLRELCAQGTARTRGWHRCNLCPKDAPYPVAIDDPEVGRYLVGDAEIRVPGQDGIVYAAPTMVIHYVQEHAYRPPDDFIAAVLAA